MLRRKVFSIGISSRLLLSGVYIASKSGQDYSPILKWTQAVLLIVRISHAYRFNQRRTLYFAKSPFIRLCRGGITDPTGSSRLVITSSSLYAVSKVANSIDLAFGLIVDVSCFAISSDDFPVSVSTSISRKIDLKGEL